MTDSFAAFKLQDAIEAIIALQEGVREPRVMQVYEAMETCLKALQYAINEGMATRCMYAESREEVKNLTNRIKILEGILAAPQAKVPLLSAASTNAQLAPPSIPACIASQPPNPSAT